MLDRTPEHALKVEPDSTEPVSANVRTKAAPSGAIERARRLAAGLARAEPQNRIAATLAVSALVLAALAAHGDIHIGVGLVLFGLVTIAVFVTSTDRWLSANRRVELRRQEPASIDLVPSIIPAIVAGAVPLLPVPEAVQTQVPPPVIDRGRAILAAIPDAALVVDRDGLIIETNPLVAEVFPRGRPGLLVNQMCRSPEVGDAVERALTGSRVVVEIEEWVPVRRKLLMTVTALALPDELPPAPQPALLIVFRDVSEQEKLAQMRADFIANASHELRTPLASLRGFVETLQGPARDDAVARERFLAIMATQAGRMTRLIDDLLSLSRVEMRAHVPPTGTVDLQDVAAHVVQTMEPLAAAGQAQITFARLDTPVRIRGDRDELVQVVQNLVQNALKYGRPTGGHIALRMLRQTRAPTDRRRITLEIEDDGPGIATVHLPRLTERFYRVSPTVSRDRGGTGLGLAIVKNIIARHRGELGIRSEVGKGSTFTITLDELPG